MNFDNFEEVLFSNFSYDPEVYYFLYLGDIKNYNLNDLFKECLQKQTTVKTIQFIAVVPDIFHEYNHKNIIVINPAISQHASQPYKSNQDNTQSRISLRVGTAEFMTAASKSPAIRSLIKQILMHQKGLNIYMWESVPEMSLDEIPGVRIIGPKKELSQKFNNKIIQYTIFKDILPLADHCICKDSNELLKATKERWEKWGGKIFISSAYSAAGANAVITENQQQVANWCEMRQGDFLVSRYIPHDQDPTVLAVVANEDDVYIAGVADQVIEDGRRFIGSTYPSIVTDAQRKTLHEYTVRVGKILGRNGYRGIFGCDYIIDHKEDIYFIEINARKQGTTLEFCFTLEHLLPEGSPLLPELEYSAVMANCFPSNTIEPDSKSGNLYWGTYNYKLHKEQVTSDYIQHDTHERQSFKKVARGELQKDFVMLEHIGKGFNVMPGTFLARVVSVATVRDEMEAGLQQGVKMIKQTIEEA